MGFWGSNTRLIDIKSLSRKHLIQKISTKPSLGVVSMVGYGQGSIKAFPENPIFDNPFTGPCYQAIRELLFD